MESINVLFCDDENEARNMISSSFTTIFRDNGYETNSFMAADIKEAKMKLEKQLVDLAVLDIDMPNGSGIALGRFLRDNNNTIPIIFVSNREDKVFDSLKVEPIAFVRKSHILEDLPDAAKRFISKRKAFLEKKIIVENRDRIISIPLSEIIYFEGARNRQIIHVTLTNEHLSTGKNMQELEEALDSEGFIRIHKGFLVNYKFVRIIKESNVVLTNGENLPVSRRRIQEVKRKYLLNMQRHSAII